MIHDNHGTIYKGLYITAVRLLSRQLFPVHVRLYVRYFSEGLAHLHLYSHLSTGTPNLHQTC